MRLFKSCGYGVHKFTARYEEVPSGVKLDTVTGCSAESFRKLLILDKYVKDVCVRCGKEIKR